MSRQYGKISVSDPEKAKAAIKQMISSHYQMADELRNYYRALTGECPRCDSNIEYVCYDCREEAREKQPEVQQ